MDGVTADDDGGGPIDEDAEEEPVPLPMQISSSSMTSHTQSTQSNMSDIEITHMTNQRNMLETQVRVKQEPVHHQQQETQYSHGGMMQGMGAPQQSETGLGAYSFPISPKPYQCSICRKAFKSVHVLQKHTMTFHTPGGGGGGGSLSRGRGRGTRGSKPRGRGRGTTVSRPTIVQQPFQSPPMPIIKPETDQNRFVAVSSKISIEIKLFQNVWNCFCETGP